MWRPDGGGILHSVGSNSFSKYDDDDRVITAVREVITDSVVSTVTVFLVRLITRLYWAINLQILN